jgi:L-aminopeptidase/D-esterase-like protein
MMDGDTLFCLATQEKKADLNLIGALAVEAVAQAVLNAVVFADKVGFLESVSSIRRSMP